MRTHRPNATTSAAVLMLLAAAMTPSEGRGDIRSTLVASGLSRPVQVLAPPQDFLRLFVLEQHTGHIRVIKEGVLLSEPFLTVGPLTTGSEQGLLGMAFHPDYEQNRRFYVYYTTTGGTSRVSEFLRSETDPDKADATSQRIILTQAQDFANHNAGQIHFGPNDGFLYIAFGDGGSGGDPLNRAQSINTLLGKIVRIDVDDQDPGKEYAVPPTNPFVGEAPLDEIWALGLRNPWRFSFDRQTHDMYIGDVGQNQWEEINFQPAASPGGENYGWRCYEGNAEFNLTGCPPASELVFPVHVYPISGQLECAVVGGFVYRGASIPSLAGRYLFSDNCSSRVWSFVLDDGEATDLQDHTAALAPDAPLLLRSVSSFGEDAHGELYLCNLLDGLVFRIDPVIPVRPGDFDDDEDVDLDDFGFLQACFTPIGTPLPPGCDIADLTGDNAVGQTDVSVFEGCMSGANIPSDFDCAP